MFDFIKTIMSKVYGGRFVNVLFITEVETAAKFRHMKIEKSTSANGQCFGTLKEFTDCWKNAVITSGMKIDATQEEKLKNFETSENWFTHYMPECFSMIEKKSDPEEKYLWLRVLSAKSEYQIDGKEATKEEVSEFLTPSARKKLMEPEEHVTNKKNRIVHDVICRTIKLKNIQEFK